MPDQDPNKPYIDAIANLRDTAKWIVSSAAALAVLILGGTSLNSIGSLDPGWRLYLAMGSSLLSVVLAGLIMAMAVRVMTATAGINFDVLRTKCRYRRHRQYIESFVLGPQSQPEFRTLEAMQDTYRTAEAKYRADPGDASLKKAFEVCHQYVMLVVNAGRWRDVTYRFQTMTIVFVVASVVILVLIYAFIWAANPPKDIGNVLDKPLVEKIAFPDTQLGTLESAGLALNCLRPALHVLIYKERPANVVEAYTLPDNTPLPSVTCPVRKLVYETKTLTVLRVQ